MEVEVKEKLEVRKTVPIRADIRKSIHKRLKTYHKTKPRTIFMEDTINELIDLGLKSLGK
jgi:hypothetical protein